MAAPLTASGEALKMISLRDGTQVPASAYITTIIRLTALVSKYFIAFSDLVEKCRDNHFKFSAHQIEDSRAILIENELLDANDRVHDVAKSIILNFVEGEGLSMKIVPSISFKNYTDSKNE